MPGIAQVHVDSWRTAYAGIVPESYLAALSYGESESIWKRLIGEIEVEDRPLRSLHVAEVSGEVRGFAMGGPGRSGDLAYSGELQALYVLSGYQRHGIGKSLARATVERLLERGMHSMLVWVLADNPSRRFYERLGGSLIGEQEIEIGGATLLEVSYGWKDLRATAELLRAE